MKKLILPFLLLFLFADLAISYAHPSGKKKSTAGKGNDADSIKPADVLFSFVFMGCNRVDDKDTSNPNAGPSTANLPELQRTFSEVCQLDPKPDFFFFLGDLVLGLEQNPTVLSNQLQAWLQVYHNASFSPIARSGIKMIAVPGNHEMLYKGAGGELPWKALSTWQSLMSSFMPDGPVMRVGGKDSMNNLQTYSFNYKNTHFIMMNTDTWNNKNKIGILPAKWIVSDMANARKDQSITHIFLLGHKPSYVDAKINEADDRMDSSMTKILWPAMEQNKAEAMLSAHSHQYYRCQPDPGKSYQVIAGNGGSPYEKHLDKEHQFFGYTIVYIMKNGKVHIRSMGRSVDKKHYLETLPDSLQTTLRDKANISWGTTAKKWKAGKDTSKKK